MHDILRFLYLYTNLITKWSLLFLHEQLNFWKEVWTLPTQYLVGMLCLMLPLKVWTWETESVGHISSGVRCWEFYGWSPVTTSAVADHERVNRRNITLQSYLYKQTEYASGLLWSDDSRLAWHLNAIRPFGSSHCYNNAYSTFILLNETCIKKLTYIDFQNQFYFHFTKVFHYILISQV